MRSLAALSSLALLGAVPSPTVVPDATSDPYAMYDRARNVLSAQRYPDRLQYRVTVGIVDAGIAERERYTCESVNGDVRPLGVSDEEREAPHYASGVNLRLVMSLAWNQHSGGPTHDWSAAANRKEALPDLLGVPLISPAYMFGMNAAVDDATPAPADESATLHSIATVVAQNRAYAIAFVGEESLRGIPAYHLQLRPLRSPAVHRLRDLWIETSTYDVLQANLQGNFTNAPMTLVPWTVEFATVNGATYITSETTTSPLRFRRDRTFDGAIVSFDDVAAATTTLPVLPNVLEDGVLRER